MRAVRLHAVGDLRCEQLPAPGELAAGHARVRVRAAGICGSDLHNYRTGQWLTRAPVTPGHEFAGEVLAVAADVTSLRVGERVVGDSRVSCGLCPRCLAGRPNVCDRMGYVGEVCEGAFAEVIDLPAQHLLPVPPGVAFCIAALAEPLGVALRVLRRLDAPPDTPILIAGAGPIGGLAALLLAHLGFGPLGVIERNAERAQLVASVTGARILDAQMSQLAEFTGGQGLLYAIEATGSQAMLSFVLGALAGGGRLAMVGIFSGEQSVTANAIVERELDIRGCSVFCGEQREILGLLPALAAKLARLISTPISLEQLPQAYQQLLQGASPWLKTIVEP